MVNARTLPARILANLVIWGILVLGAFFILTFKDWTMGMELGFLCLCEFSLFLFSSSYCSEVSSEYTARYADVL